MSKIKSPQEKKAQSLLHDRRNTYGENDKSSRKNIAKSKQIQHQSERHAANQVLSAVVNVRDDEGFIELEVAAETVAKADRLSGFKKWPDEPLGKVIGRQNAQRERRGMYADKKIRP